jgi:hypothetical protein
MSDAYHEMAARILEALRANPDGLDIHQLRELVLQPGDDQQHFDRRLRELDPYFRISRQRRDKRFVYVMEGPRPPGEWAYGEVSKTLRARIFHKARGRCQMCGLSVEEDGVKLHVDHKIPSSWGGATEEKNLWALCAQCNEGKRDYFASFDPELMREVMQHPSVHERIARLLKARMGDWVDCDLIEFVANAVEFQTDWRKRLRELRYLGLVIKVRRAKSGHRHISQYKLVNWLQLPEDPTAAARAYERERADRNRRKR